MGITKDYLWVLLFGLLTVCAGTNTDDGGCPESCSCSVIGVAVCTDFNSAQKFEYSFRKLIIENARDLVMKDNMFSTVGLQDTQYITIMSSTFQKLNAKAFSDLQNLAFLNLEGNNHMVLHPDMFNTTNLVYFGIKHSKLTFVQQEKYLFDIPTVNELELVNCDVAPMLTVDSFSKMPLLQSINLASNMLKHVEPMFSTLEDLEQVDLSDNMITDLKPDIFAGNNNMDVLILHKNPLTSIKGLNIARLTDLDLSLCKLNKIDAEMFAGLPSLTRLNLSGNAISEIEAQAFLNQEDLVHVDLSSNALKGPLASDMFLPNRQLQVISFAHNPSLKALPAKFFNGLDELFRLDLSYCGLMNLEENLFEGLDSLINLNLAGNIFHEIKSNMLAVSIIELDLSHNNITNLNNVEFAPFSKIQSLSLANNRLNEISTNHFVELGYLKKLDLNSCGLHNLWIRNENRRPAVMRNLAVLLLSKNIIEKILPQQLQLTPHLRVIDISENQLTCDDNFHESLKWLNDHNVEPIGNVKPSKRFSREVRPGHPYGNDALFADETDFFHAERINRHSWNFTEMLVCGYKEREPLGPESEDPDLDDDIDEEDEEDDDGDYIQNKPGLMHDIEIKEVSVEERFGNVESYLWPIVIVAISGIAILLSLSVLSCFALRWYRQKNSYGAAMLNHLNTPRMRRDRSSIYQQLHEELNSPTTPVMSIKLGSNGKSGGYITCARDDKVTPQSV